MLAFSRLHQMAEIQVIGVHHRIYGHKARLLVVAVLLIGLEKLAVVAIGYNKQVIDQRALCLVAQIGPIPVDNVAAVGRDRIGRDGGLFVRQIAQQRRVHDLRARRERPGLVRRRGRRLFGCVLCRQGQHRLGRAGREQAADQQQRKNAQRNRMFHGRTTFV